LNSWRGGNLTSVRFDHGELGHWHGFDGREVGGREFGGHDFGPHGFGGDWGSRHGPFEGEGFSFLPDLLALLNPFRVVGSLGLDLLSTGLNLLDSAIQAETGYANGGYPAYGGYGYGVYGGVFVPSYVAPAAPTPLVAAPPPVALAPVQVATPVPVPCTPGYMNCPH
jgi:hypothetical protein